jgi:hypothetical protein
MEEPTIKTFQSLAGESLVLLTVAMVCVVAYLAWVKVVKPAMDVQAGIVKGQAEAIHAIRDTATAQAAISQAQAATAQSQAVTADAQTKQAQAMQSMTMELVRAQGRPTYQG